MKEEKVNVKVIDGKNAVLGRLAAYVAKEALKGETIAIINSDQIIITGSKKNIEADFLARRSRVGSGQRGPKLSVLTEKVVKKAISGMLPNVREGRGKIALQKIKCYRGVPKEFEGMKALEMFKNKSNKYIYVREISK